MDSTADPPTEPAAAEARARRGRVSRLLGGQWVAPALAVAAVCVALLTQFSIVAGTAIPSVGFGFVPAGILFGGAALSMSRTRRATSIEAPFELTMRWELALLAGIVALAAFFRFFRFTEFPPGLWYDEAVNGTDALWIIDRSHLTVWRSSNFGHSTLYFYLLIASFKTFGYTVFAFRLVPALAGLTAVVAFYFLARWLLSPVPALVATALLAVSRYAVTFSRISWEASLQPLLEIMAVYFLVRALETKNKLLFFLAGGSLAAGLYTYLGFRFVPIVVLFFLVYIAAAQWRLLRNNVPGLVIYAVSFIAVVAPLGQFAIRHQDLFLERTRAISVFNEIDRDHSYEPLTSNIAATFKMMNVAGDRNGRHNLPGAPMLDGVSAALLVLGVAVSLWSFRSWREGGMLGWLVLAVAPGAFTISSENPSAIRDIGALPPLFLLVGLAVNVLYRSLSATRAGLMLFGVAAVSMAGASAGINYHDFFDRQAHNQNVYDSFQPPYTRIGEIIADRSGAEDVYVANEFTKHPAVSVLARGKKYRTFNPTRDLVLARSQRDTLLILDERQFGLLPTLQRLYPDLSRDDFADPFGRISFTRVTVPASDVDTLHQLRLTVHDGAGSAGPVLWSAGSAIDRDWTASDLGPHGTVTAVWDGYLWSAQASQGAAFGVEAPGDVTIELDGKTVARGTGNALAENLTLGPGQHSLNITAVLHAAGSSSVSYSDEQAPKGVAASDLLYGRSAGTHGFQVVYHQGDNSAGQVVAAGRLPFAVASEQEAGGVAIEYRGVFRADAEGEYGFGLRGENPSQLFVDDDLVVDNGGSHGPRDVRSSTRLSAGDHVVSIQYLVRNGPDWALYLRRPGGDWVRADGSEFEPVPPSYVAPQPVALTPDPAWGGAKTFAGLDSPAAVTVLSDGTVIVASGNRLAFIDQAGNPLRSTSLDAGTDVVDLASTPAGDVIAADGASRRLVALDKGGNPAHSIGGLFPSVNGVDVRGDIAFVASANRGLLFAVSLSGGEAIPLEMSAPGVEDRAVQPSDLAVAANGTVFAADFERGTIVISTDGRTARAVKGVLGVGTRVPHMAISRDVLLVTDPVGGRVVIYDMRGRQRGAFTFPSRNDETGPVGIAATADGHVYVACTSGEVYAFLIAAPPDLGQH